MMRIGARRAVVCAALLATVAAAGAAASPTFTLGQGLALSTFTLGQGLALSAFTLGQGLARPQGVVLVTIDTLRADRLGVYGGPATLTPNLDALAAEGVTFEQASAACPATGPSVATLLTGHHRATHGVRRNNQQIDQRVVTLAEALSGAGFESVGAVANPVVKGAGFAQGFVQFGMPETLVRQGPTLFAGGPLLARAEELLDGVGSRRFFLWLHLMDPHGPYFPPKRFQGGADGESYRRPEDAQARLGTSNYGFGIIPKYQRVGEEADPAVFRARYDGEIGYVDALVGQLVRTLGARGLWDRVVFVVTADHGEELGERGVFFQHGWHVYENSVRVPLVMHAPGLPAGRRVKSSVGVVDVMPTILELAGVPAPAGLDGRSLVPLMHGPERDRTAFVQSFYGNRLTALRRGRWKYVYTPPPPPVLDDNPYTIGPRRDGRTGDGWRTWWPTASREELYDLVVDPGETHDLAAARPDVTTRFRKKLVRWRRGQLAEARRRRRSLHPPAAPPTMPGRAPGPPASRKRQLEIKAQLRALGYLD
jgi:arylsulfatase